MFMIDLGAQSYYSMLDVSPAASPKEINSAWDRVGKELRHKQAQASEEEKQRLEKRLQELNSIGNTLASLETREEYDRKNAHLKFFVLQVAAAPLFVEKADRLHVLHATLQRFLAVKGVTLPPLSDLDRTDFSEDETPNELLDNLLKEDEL